MANLYAVAGSHIYIGSVVDDQDADFVESDLSGLSYVEIGGWSQAGAIGDSAQLITADLINRDRTYKQKGTRNAGSMQNVFARDSDDTGQTALLAAAAADDNYAFKIEWADGSTDYFIALVMMGQKQGGGANTIQNLTATLEINSNVVSV